MDDAPPSIVYCLSSKAEPLLRFDTLSYALAVWNENVSALPMYLLTSRENSLYLNDIAEGIEHEPSAKFWRADMVVYVPDNTKDAATLVGALRPTWSDSCPV